MTNDNSEISAAGSSNKDLLFATSNKHRVISRKKRFEDANKSPTFCQLRELICSSMNIFPDLPRAQPCKSTRNTNRHNLPTCAALAEKRFLLAARSEELLLALFGLAVGTTRLRADWTVSRNSRVLSLMLTAIFLEPIKVVYTCFDPFYSFSRPLEMLARPPQQSVAGLGTCTGCLRAKYIS